MKTLIRSLKTYPIDILTIDEFVEVFFYRKDKVSKQLVYDEELSCNLYEQNENKDNNIDSILSYASKHLANVKNDPKGLKDNFYGLKIPESLIEYSESTPLPEDYGYFESIRKSHHDLLNLSEQVLKEKIKDLFMKKEFEVVKKIDIERYVCQNYEDSEWDVFFKDKSRKKWKKLYKKALRDKFKTAYGGFSKDDLEAAVNKFSRKAIMDIYDLIFHEVIEGEAKMHSNMILTNNSIPLPKGNGCHYFKQS